MSVAVDLERLGEVVAGYGLAYLLTVSDAGTPRVLAVSPRVEGSSIVFGGAGGSTLSNLAARPNVTLLWPPLSADQLSLIVDGTAVAGEDGLVKITATSAILHVPRPS